MPIDGQAMSRTSSGGFQTSDGTLYVSKPFKSKSSKKLRAVITFAPRQSTFDINNESSGANEFRGFFTLFWISIFIFTVRTYVRSIETNGHALNLVFATMFSKDAITLALSDAVLVGSTSVCVLFAKAISNRWIRYHWTGLVIQHIFQTSVLIVAVGWTFNRDWPWVQSGFFTLHTLVMIMKMHSYMTVNGYLQSVSEQSQAILKQLRAATETEGGWDHAISVASQHRVELDGAGSNESSFTTESSPARTPGGSSPIGTYTPPIIDGAQTSYVDPETAKALRKRLASMSNTETKSTVQVLDDAAAGTGIDAVAVAGAGADKKTDESMPSVTTPHPLVDHPSETISNLAKEYTEIQSELVSTGPIYITWPNNITFSNFALYMLIPTLVYDLEYPRTNRIRPLYVFEKTVATFGTFALLYTVTESFILPLTPTYDQSFFRSLLDLALPFMIAYLLLFYIIFECICNAFAELSCFADRQFYEDWWNSTSQAEFSRKWNKPVHSFLLRHVYASTMTSYKLSKHACVHELVMVIVTRKFYLFALQLIQIPLIALNSVPFIKKNKLLGNLMFWVGLYAGFPLLCVAYVAY
ncbi:hypothetical protein BT96DRAFT_960654 [Gymnopus androsaceus JB14]|uniref:O-acyltransferase n=1 Tax=Gymnopus androsaceus JB14 TaxID=1447944 RepID=A0A6A4GL48_9AGAR|nr:hypothetical protein BT96DRAFT_960654 [Gymnopus androsaceus JB14]